MATVRVGIPGWRYEPWRSVFYPPNLEQLRELEFAATAFRTLESRVMDRRRADRSATRQLVSRCNDRDVVDTVSSTVAGD